MSDVATKAETVVDLILAEQDPTDDREHLAATRSELVRAFCLGAAWGLERGQHALAITHAKVLADMPRGRP